MKATIYILGTLAFGTFILISKPLPKEPSEEFKAKRVEMTMKEQALNYSITKVENELQHNKTLIEVQFDSIKVNNK